MNDLVPVLQTAIGPVILISGVGLLMLSMTNRFARVIDRSRLLLVTAQGAPGPQRDRIRAEMVVMLGRARLLRRAIAMAAVSVLLAALLVVTLFVVGLTGNRSSVLISTLFGASMLSLIGAMVTFIQDINVSLRALQIEAGQLWK